jgi:hypothetical protein
LSLHDVSQVLGKNAVDFLPMVRYQNIHTDWSESEKKNMFYSEESMKEILYEAWCEKMGVDPEEYWQEMIAAAAEEEEEQQQAAVGENDEEEYNEEEEEVYDQEQEDKNIA